ncbi:MAG: hypothetical protein WKF30_19260 [Pyrinomonadaceae bacterium]
MPRRVNQWPGVGKVKPSKDRWREAEERAKRPKQTAPDSPVERARLERLEALRLSHARTVNQLKNARSPAHRAMLERALAHLEAQIKELVGSQNAER